MLALYSAIPEAARRTHAVLANPFGALERPRAELIAPLAGKVVVVVGDRDEAGRKGAARWGEAITRVARETRVLEIAGPGKDLRDWLLHVGTSGRGNVPQGDAAFDELRALARGVEPLRASEAPDLNEQAARGEDGQKSVGRRDSGREETEDLQGRLLNLVDSIRAGGEDTAEALEEFTKLVTHALRFAEIVGMLLGDGLQLEDLRHLAEALAKVVGLAHLLSECTI